MIPIAKVENTVTLGVGGGRRIRFASLPQASVHQIVSVTGECKRVGVVMIGGTREQFEHHVGRHRELCLVRGNRTGRTFMPSPASSSLTDFPRGA